MTKNEFKKYITAKLASLGYSARRCYYSKIYDDNYLIGFSLEGSTYCKGYRLTCGIIYLPDNYKMPFHGVFDLQRDYVFPMGPSDSRDIHRCIEDLEKKYSIKNNIFKYEYYTVEELDRFFDANYKYITEPFLDQNYGLSVLRSDWRMMNRFSAQNVVKLCERAGLNPIEVLEFLGKKTNGNSTNGG